jgi:hypothetical protein
MMNIKKATLGFTAIAGLALSSIALAELPPPPKKPTPGPTPIQLTQPKVVSLGASLACGGSGAKVSAVISGGSLGARGRVIVKGSATWTTAFNVAANTQQTIVVQTAQANCLAPGYLGVEVDAPNLKVKKSFEPGSVTYREWAGPI